MELEIRISISLGVRKREGVLFGRYGYAIEMGMEVV